MTPHECLTQALARIPDSVEEMRDALRFINDAPNFEEFFGALTELAMIHARGPDNGLATEFATLRGDLAQVLIEPLQRELAEDRWRALRGARGNLYADIDAVLIAAGALGIRPDQPSLRLPEAVIIGRADQEGRLSVLEDRLREVTTMLVERIAPEGISGEGRSAAQLIHVKHYLAIMYRNIRLFNLTVHFGDLIDLASLERVISVMGRVTQVFYLTVINVASRATQALKRAASVMRAPVARLARGLRTIVNMIIRSEKDPAKVPPSDFSLTEVRKMILSGQTPPPSWRPWITSLDFTGTELRDLSPLSELVELESLDLNRTPIHDIRPLVGLTKLKTLYLTRTDVRDVAALAELTSLTSLSLALTRVTDISPLGSLFRLSNLSLRGMRLDSLKPLARLSGLKVLTFRSSTWQGSLAPLGRLQSLTLLILRNTSVKDLTALSHLGGLVSLDLGLTQVTDLSPLADLPSLKHICISGEAQRKKLAVTFPRPEVITGRRSW